MPWPPVPVDPRHQSGVADISHPLQHGGQNFGQTLALAVDGGQISHLGRTGTRVGTNPGRVLRGLCTPGLPGPGVNAGCPEHPHRTVLEDRPGGQFR